VLTSLLGEILDVARYGPHGGKLCHLCQGSYIWSTQRKQNLRSDRHFIRNSNFNHKSWIYSQSEFRIRSQQCVDTNISRRPFRQSISILYLSNMRYQLSFTSMYPCKQTNNQHRTDLLSIKRPLESPATCNYTQPDKTWVECASWLSFIPLWLVAYYIFLRTFHFSLSSSSPFPQQQVMATQTPQHSVIESESSQTTGASSNAPLA